MTKLLAIRRFCYIEVLFRIFYYDLGKENRFYIPRPSLYRSSLYRSSTTVLEHPALLLLLLSTCAKFYLGKNERGGGWWGRLHYLSA